MKFFSKRHNPIQKKEELETSLKKIISILDQSNNSPQARVMESALNSLKTNNEKEFTEISKSVDLWGGSGAVWEVNIEDKALSKTFYFELLKFTELLKENRISNYGIRSIANFLERLVNKK
jgi:uncharacterized protein YfaS (alpha-2-macroglobulin family)